MKHILFSRPWILYILFVGGMLYFAQISLQEIAQMQADGQRAIENQRQKIVGQRRLLKNREAELARIKAKIESYKIRDEDLRKVEDYVRKEIGSTDILALVGTKVKPSKKYFNAVLFTFKIKSLSKYFYIDDFKSVLEKFFDDDVGKTLGVRPVNKKVADYYVMWLKKPGYTLPKQNPNKEN